jgi:hypothetical protein
VVQPVAGFAAAIQEHVAVEQLCCLTCPALTGFSLQCACSRGLPCVQAHLCASWLPAALIKQLTSTTPAVPAWGKRHT